MALVDENSCLYLLVGEAGVEWEGNILMHGLEHL